MTLALVALTQIQILSQPYSPADIGGPAIPGSLIDAGGIYTLTGGGTNIGGNADQFFFAYQQWTGDFDIQVRVVSLGLSDPWAKAGLMARATLDPASQFASVLASPGLNGCVFEARSITNGTTSTTGNVPVNYPNTWLRLQRVGDVLTGYAGIDGQSWSLLGTTTVTMPATVYFGLADCSHNASQATTAQIQDVGPAVVSASVQSTLPSETLGPSSRKTALVISEIMYKPAPRTDGKVIEYIELYNSNPFFEDISGYRISGDIDFTFPTNTVLQGGAFLVIARVPADVQSVYGISNVVGPYVGTLKSSGTVRLRNDRGAIYLEIGYFNQPPWPVAADGTGHSLVLARPSYGEGDARAWDISDIAGGSPGAVEAYRPSPLRSVVINEFLAHTDDPLLDYIELYNHSNQSVDLSGCSLSDDPVENRFVIPPNTIIPPRGFVVFDQAQMGFALSAAGETIYFKNPDGSRVLDAVTFGSQENGVSMGRYPDGSDGFYRLLTRTPMAPNSGIRVSEIAINEIMYAPISGDNDLQYVELYNQGASPADLSGWKFSAGIGFTIPTNTVLAAKGYLVVAKNAGHLMTNYPNLSGANTLGDFSGKLGKGERLALAMPDQIIVTNKHGVVETNTIYIDVDEVTYDTGGRWGQWANGGGSSLELIDPGGNHRLASNWADSDEASKAPWTNIETTGVLDNGANYDPHIDRIQIGLLDVGECLVDKIEVLPDGGAPNYLANPDFESGLTGWALQGDHVRSSWEPSGYASGHSLHLRCSDRVWTGANSAQTTLTNTTLLQGQTATLRFKARWLCGWPEVLLRFNGNWLEAAGRLSVPANLGTPGAPNSRAVRNAGPAIYNVAHTPSLPAANQDAVVTARVDDPDGIASLTLNYRVDPSTAYTTVPMVDDGTGGDAVAGDGIFSATIPGQPALVVTAFYVEAVDTTSVTNRFPALLQDNSPVRECVVMFGDGAPIGGFGVYHLWLTQASINRWKSLPNLSNESFDGTFVNGNRIIYNMLARYAGSPYHQQFNGPTGSLCHYKFTFPDDDKFLGATSFNKIHQPGNGPGDDSMIQREQTAYWLVRQLGLPWNYRRFVAVFVNGHRRGTLMEDTQTPDGDVVKEQFPDDADGFLYKLQPWFEFNASGTSFNNNFWCTLNDYTTWDGSKKLARYRWNYLCRRTPDSANNYTNVFALVDAANTFDPAQLDAVADMEEWMRIFAVEHAVGNWDSFGAQNGQNMYGYKPVNGKWTLFIWDYNIVLGNSSWGAGQNLFTPNYSDGPMVQIYQMPPFRRAYLRAFKELANGPMLASRVNPIVDAKYTAFQGSGVNVTSPSTIKSFIASARTAILSTVTSQDATRFAVNGPATFDTANNLVSLTGSAPVEIKTIRVNGVAYSVSWTSVTGWSLSVPVNAGVNTLNFQCFDVYGNLLSKYTASISVNYTGTVELPQDNLIINEIMSAPSAPGAEFVELYNRSPDFTFDLSNYRFNGLDYTFPEGTTIAPGSFVVLAKDVVAFSNTYGAGIPVSGMFNGKLDLNGETLTLIKPGATPADDVEINKVRYENQPPWPMISAGSGISLQVIDPTQDNRRVANWAASSIPPLSTPGAPNQILNVLPSLPTLWINEVQPENVNGIKDNTGQNDPWIELYNSGSNAVSLDGFFLANSYSNLIQWPFPPGASLNPGEFKVIFADAEPAQSTDTEWHTSFRLNAGSGSVALAFLDYNSQPQVLDYVNYSARPDHSFGSYPDGYPFGRQEFYYVTPGGTNDFRSGPLNVFINEWMASNVASLADPADNNFDDWFELYNPGPGSADLSGYYLTSNLTNKFKFQVPAGYVIPAGGFLLVWADNDSSQNSTNQPDLHVNFKLSAAGDAIGLFAADGTTIDSVTFGQQTSDFTEGRFPDGGPNVYALPFPTPRAANSGPQPNVPPVLDPIGNRSVVGGNTLAFIATATDTNLPPQTLTFSLDPGAPVGASINAVSGAFTWTPTPAQTPGTNTVTVRVTDNGSPPLNDSETFTVVIIAPPDFTQTILNGQQLTLGWQTTPGHTYRLELKNDLKDTAWIPFSSDMLASAGSLTLQIDTTGASQQYFRILLVK